MSHKDYPVGLRMPAQLWEITLLELLQYNNSETKLTDNMVCGTQVFHLTGFKTHSVKTAHGRIILPNLRSKESPHTLQECADLYFSGSKPSAELSFIGVEV